MGVKLLGGLLLLLHLFRRLFWLKFTAPVVDAHFAPVNFQNVWPGGVPATFANCFLFFYVEAAITTFFIRQHISPHSYLMSLYVISLKRFCVSVNILQGSTP